MKKFLIVVQVQRLNDYWKQREIQLKLFKIMESMVFSKQDSISENSNRL